MSLRQKTRLSENLQIRGEKVGGEKRELMSCHRLVQLAYFFMLIVSVDFSLLIFYYNFDVILHLKIVVLRFP